MKKILPLERNGISLYLSCDYKTEDTVRDILLVHGVTYSSHKFDVDYGDYSFVKYLADKGYRVWSLDIAGFGRSGEVADGFAPDSDYAAEDIFAAAQAITAYTGNEKIDLLGWSWGTVTTSRFAAKHPELLRKLVLYAPILTGMGKADIVEPFHKNTWEDAVEDYQLTADGEIDFDIIEPPVVAQCNSNSWRYDGKGSPNGGRRDIFTDGLLIDMSKISVPTMIIYGDKDPYMNLPMLRGMRQSDTLQIREFAGAAHAMMVEKPYYKCFRETVYGFLK